MTRVQYVEYKRKNTIGGSVLKQEKREILCPECRIEKKKAMVKLESGGILYRGKSIVDWHMGRDSKKYSKEGE